MALSLILLIVGLFIDLNHGRIIPRSFAQRSNKGKGHSGGKRGHSAQDINLQAETTCYDDAQCDECFECNEGGTRCVEIEGCYTRCYSDVDCQRNQYCNPHNICEDEPETCYDDDECRNQQICDLSRYQCVDPPPAPITPGCCAGTSASSTTRCNNALDEGFSGRMSSC